MALRRAARVPERLLVGFELFVLVRRQPLQADDLVELLVVQPQDLLGGEATVVGLYLPVSEASLGVSDDVLEVHGVHLFLAALVRLRHRPGHFRILVAAAVAVVLVLLPIVGYLDVVQLRLRHGPRRAALLARGLEARVLGVVVLVAEHGGHLAVMFLRVELVVEVVRTNGARSGGTILRALSTAVRARVEPRGLGNLLQPALNLLALERL